MRNVPALIPIYVAVADQRSADDHDIDPVCRMLVAEGREAGTLRHREMLYRFCSHDCARQFLRDPDAYAAP
jgi:YHS domain-containing protein